MVHTIVRARALSLLGEHKLTFLPRRLQAAKARGFGVTSIGTILDEV